MEILTDFLEVLGNAIDIVNGQRPCLSALGLLTTLSGCIPAILPRIHDLMLDKRDLLT